MTDNLIKIKKIISLETYSENPDAYQHLFEVQLPPENINLFKVRHNFEMGTPLVGDLVLDLESEKMLELHPFPEWVVFLKSYTKVKSKPYLIVPNFPKSFIKKISRKSINQKIEFIQGEIETITINDLIGFKYDLGINILVPAFVPHFFISSKINKDAGESPPYLQVFEPNLDILTKNLQIKMSYFFKLPFSVYI